MNDEYVLYSTYLPAYQPTTNIKSSQTRETNLSTFFAFIFPLPFPLLLFSQLRGLVGGGHHIISKNHPTFFSFVFSIFGFFDRRSHRRIVHARVTCI